MLHIQVLPTFAMTTHLTILPSPERAPQRPGTVWEIRAIQGTVLDVAYSRVTYLYYGNPFNNTKS